MHNLTKKNLAGFLICENNAGIIEHLLLQLTSNIARSSLKSWHSTYVFFCSLVPLSAGVKTFNKFKTVGNLKGFCHPEAFFIFCGLCYCECLFTCFFPYCAWLCSWEDLCEGLLRRDRWNNHSVERKRSNFFFFPHFPLFFLNSFTDSI